jgi:two-component system sensor histidine kinase/response regulator
MSTVLVIEDDAAILMLVADILTEHGYTLITAENGYSALEYARQKHPDLILLDILLPMGLDGIAVSYALSTSRETAAIPIVFMTALSPGEVRNRGGLGVVAIPILRKPFGIEGLLRIVQRYLPAPIP